MCIDLRRPTIPWNFLWIWRVTNDPAVGKDLENRLCVMPVPSFELTGVSYDFCSGVNRNGVVGMCHEHQLIGDDSLRSLPPFDGFDFTKHCASCHNGAFCNFVSIPRKEVPLTNPPKAVIGAADTLQHPVH